MISRVTGVLEAVDGARATVAPAGAGVAHEAPLPRFLADELLGRIGQTITLHTLELLESANQGASFTPRLLGFASSDDRRFFELLTTVKGVEARKALRAMAAPTAEIARAIAERDLRALQALPEIGKRLAETVVAELNGKVDAFLGAGGGAAAGGVITEGKPALRGAAEQAIAALIRLGEAPADADRLVRRAMAADAGLATADAILSAAFGMRL